jgi:CRISPR type I-E-associated protein CasB/Cse2
MPNPPNSKPSVAGLIVRAVGALREAADPGFYRLRRATRAIDAMLEPVFSQLRTELALNDLWQPTDELLAFAVLIVARIPEGARAEPLGQALRNQPRRYSDLRFRTLVMAQSPEALFTQLLQAVRYCNYDVSPFNLVDIVLGWTEARVDETRKRLATQFHGLSRSERPSASVRQS